MAIMYTAAVDHSSVVRDHVQTDARATDCSSESERCEIAPWCTD